MTLYEMTREMVELYEALDTVDFDNAEEREQVLNDTLEAIGLNDKLDAYGKLIRTLEADCDFADKEIKRLVDRKNQKTRSINWLKNSLLNFLSQTESGKAETQLFKFSTRKTTRVNVDGFDPAKAPERFIRTKTTVEADKTAIKEALKNGETVEGAFLETVTSATVK